MKTEDFKRLVRKLVIETLQRELPGLIQESIRESVFQGGFMSGLIQEMAAMQMQTRMPQMASRQPTSQQQYRHPTFEELRREHEREAEEARLALLQERAGSDIHRRYDSLMEQRAQIFGGNAPPSPHERVREALPQHMRHVIEEAQTSIPGEVARGQVDKDLSGKEFATFTPRDRHGHPTTAYSEEAQAMLHQDGVPFDTVMALLGRMS